jgi:flagellar basal body-associated protein FliL
VKKKLIAVVAVLLLAGVGGAAYMFVLSPKPAKAAKKPHIVGTLFTLSPEFVVNLAGNHFAKVTVALLLEQPPVLDPNVTDPTLVQDAAIRATITDELTGLPTDDLVIESARHALEGRILKDLGQTTDTEVSRVLFTDVVVQ